MAAMMNTARDEARQVEPLTARFPGFDLPAAYAVARRMFDARCAAGARPVGRKIGFTNADLWDQYGVREPIWAHMYDSTVVRVAGGVARCSLRAFTEPKIEPEIVVHFASAPPLGGDLAQILQAIDWVAHGFEIVQSHFRGWKFHAADTVADGGLHGALYVGEPQPVSQLGPALADALRSFAVELACNGSVREVAHGSNVLGSPLAAIAHLIAVLAEQPLFAPLQAGEMVTTGTITQAYSVRAGETWRTAFQGIALPGLELEFTP
jgi:2-oxo-3-hexenedioate decarboxylase